MTSHLIKKKNQPVEPVYLYEYRIVHYATSIQRMLLPRVIFFNHERFSASDEKITNGEEQAEYE